MIPATDDLPRLAATLPESPGVYLFSDADRGVVYVGKAKNLRRRVQSYFQRAGQFKSDLIQRHARGLEYILTDTELEALLLENNLIKKYQPRFNILLKDDSSYPYLCLTIREEFPRLLVTRTDPRDGSLLLGPFVRADNLKKFHAFLVRHFRLRSCGADFSSRSAACLEKDIGRCDAPCVGRIDPAAYRARLDLLMHLMKGRTGELRTLLANRIEEYCAQFEFERARELRELFVALDEVTARQKMVLPGCGDIDIFVGCGLGRAFVVEIFFVRDGKLVGHHHHSLENVDESERDSAFAAALEGHYLNSGGFVPEEILVNRCPRRFQALEGWIVTTRGRGVKITRPAAGLKKRYLLLLEKNARVHLEKICFDRRAALPELKRLLELDRLPRIIEGFDISHTGGEEKVASLIHCRDGVLQKGKYRSFIIRTVPGNDDFASLSEAVTRRLRRLKKESPDDLPDLVLLDGGLGQVSSVQAALRCEFESFPALVGLAKKEETVVRQDGEILRLDLDNPGLKLLIAIRDECHRRALKHHRNRREKRDLHSSFQRIPGIGPGRARLLSRVYGTLPALAGETAKGLAGKTGLPEKLCARVAEFLVLYFGQKK